MIPIQWNDRVEKKYAHPNLCSKRVATTENFHMQDVRPLLQLRIVKTDVACCLNVVHILGGFKSTITGCFLSDQQILWPIKPKIWRLNFIRFIWIVQNRRAISNFRTICVNHIWVGWWQNMLILQRLTSSFKTHITFEPVDMSNLEN